MELIFTDRRIIASGKMMFRYRELAECYWITDHPDPMVQARMKRTHFHRIVCKLADGRVMIVEHLGQAVFPLLRFLESVIP